MKRRELFWKVKIAGWGKKEGEGRVNPDLNKFLASYFNSR